MSGKTYALNGTLPGMKCEATVDAISLNKEYCNCITDAVYASYTDTNLPFYKYIEYLAQVFQPQEYVIAIEKGAAQQEIEVLDFASARPSKMATEKVCSLYIQQPSEGYRIGIRDISAF